MTDVLSTESTIVMNPYDNQLNNFLIQQKKSFLKVLKENDEMILKNWVITIGNEAGDLDSLASSISTAFLSSQSTSSSTFNYVPLIQINSKEDLKLRPENLLALKNSFIQIESLTFISDLFPTTTTTTKATESTTTDAVKDSTTPLEKIATKSTTLSNELNYFLVDQNKLSTSFTANGDGDETGLKVIGILDHHSDEGLYLTASPRIITPFIVGSCSSLVTNYFTSILPHDSIHFPSNLIDLLLSALLIDTSLKPLSKGGKGGEEDDKAAKFLIPHSSFASASPSTTIATQDTSALVKPTGELLNRLDALIASKFDLEGMSGRDLLRRDYKEYEDNDFKYGLSTVPVGFKNWLEKVRIIKAEGGGGDIELTGWKAVENDLEGWVNERGLDMLGVLTSFTVAASTSSDAVVGIVGGKEKEKKAKKAKKSLGDVLKGLLESKDEKAQRKKLKKQKEAEEAAATPTTAGESSSKESKSKGEHQREILIYIKNSQLLSIYSGLEKDTTLELIDWKAGNLTNKITTLSPIVIAKNLQVPKLEERNWRLWNQNNPKVTRKQVAPILKALVLGVIRK